MEGINLIDGVIIAIITISALVGIFRGLVKETITLVTWGLATYLANAYGISLGQLFESVIETELIRQVIGGSVIFISVIIIGGIINRIVGKMVKVSGFSIADRVLGMGLGALRGGTIVLVLIFVLANSLSEEEHWKNSALQPKFQSILDSIVSQLPEDWMNKLNEWKGVKIDTA